MLEVKSFERKLQNEKQYEGKTMPHVKKLKKLLSLFSTSSPILSSSNMPLT